MYFKNGKKYCLTLWICLLAIGINAAAHSDASYEYEVTVVDEKGNPLIGVNVYSENQRFAAATDENGKVTLVDIAYSEKITFSYTGYTTVTYPFYKIRQLGGRVRMSQALDILPTAVVVGRRDEKPSEIPYQIGTVTQDEIEFTHAQTTADALVQHENVFVQKSQMGGGSINIRGFEANKVLLVVDGVRLNNIIYRNGHLQDAIKVDVNALEQIEVFYGPGSLNYGSDALGGTVHFRTRDPKLYDGEDPDKNYVTSTDAFLRYASANTEKTAHVALNYGTEKWGSFSSLTYTDYDDLRAGANRPAAFPAFGSRTSYVDRDGEDIIRATVDSNVQTPTGYSQFDFLQKIKYQPHSNLYYVLNFQYSNSTDVPRYDFLTNRLESGDFEFSEWYYGPQQRLLLSLKSQLFKSTGIFNKMTLIGSVQRIDEDRYRRKLNNAWRRFTLEDVYVLGLTADFDKRLGRQGMLTYGLDANHNILFSEAGQINVETEQSAGGVMTRYPSGGSYQTNLGAYANIRWQRRDSILGLFSGLRYTWTQLQSYYDAIESDPIRWPQYFYTEGVSTLNSALTWSAGLTAQTRDKWQVKLSASSAFHAPNVDDFAKFRSRNFYISVPNPDLQPEKTVNTEIVLSKEFGSVHSRSGFNLLISGSAFYTLLRDAIVREDYQLPNGDTLLFSNGVAYRVQANVNHDKAYIAGGSGNVLITAGKHWELKSNAGYSWGRIVGEEETSPLDHIPPLFGATALSYNASKFRIAFILRYNAMKPAAEYAGGEDNIEYAIKGYGIYNWTTYNLYSSFRVSEAFSIEAAFENMTDLHYRTFSSGVSAPGRNFILSLKGRF